MTPTASAVARIALRSDPLAVRDSLHRLFAMAPLCDLADDARGTVEIVLAEALNNIVEHAYQEYDGPIEVRLEHAPPALLVEIVDHGRPMPRGTLPEGVLRPLADHDQLPEGGFGWFLIRTLATDLDYRRIDGTNHLRFRLTTG